MRLDYKFIEQADQVIRSLESNKGKHSKELNEHLSFLKTLNGGIERAEIKRRIRKSRQFNLFKKIGIGAALIGLMSYGLFFIIPNSEVEPIYQAETLIKYELSSEDSNSLKLETTPNKLAEAKENSVGIISSPLPEEEPIISSISPKAIQSFWINPKQDTLISGIEGTQIFIPKDAFGVNDSIKIELTEFYKLSDILFAGLNTETVDGKYLETGGMIKVEAFEKTNQAIKPIRKLQIGFPMHDKKKASMNLYEGRKKEELIKWTLPKTDVFEEELVSETVIEQVTVEAETFTIVEEMPSFKGCENLNPRKAEACSNKKIKDYIRANFKTPETIRRKIQRTVYVNFTISPIGIVDQIRVINNGSKDINLAIEEVLLSMPQFNPGKQRDNNVAVQFTIPIELDIDPSMEPKYSIRDLNSRVDSLKSDRSKALSQLSSKIESQLDKVDDLNDSEKSSLISTSEYYLFSTANLGWINCDRPFPGLGPRMDFVVTNNENAIYTSMILTSNSTVIKNGFRGDKTKFKRVPSKTKVILFSLHERDGKLRYAWQEAFSADREVSLKYDDLTATKLKELKAAMDQVSSF